MIEAVTFLSEVVTDTSLQAEIRANGMTFEAVQTAAEGRGYHVTGDALDAALSDNPVLLANVSQQVDQMARAAGLNKEDGSAIVKVLERLAGVTVKGGG